MPEYVNPSDAVTYTELAQWETTIYLAPETPWVVGGAYTVPTNLHLSGSPIGNYNLPHQQLANRTAWLKAEVEKAIAAPSVLVWQTTGSHTVTIPEDSRGYVEIQGWSAGGGGARGDTAEAGEGGQSGGYLYKVLDVLPGDTIEAVVGAGGAGLVGASGSAGNGGDTVIQHKRGGDTVTTLSIPGGHGAYIVSSSGGGPGSGAATPTGGDINLPGQAGVNGLGPLISGNGGAAPFGGSGSIASGIACVPAQWPGGGGAGSPDSVSNGADGGVILKIF